jgi:CubicO group peptidase (beta-lactamase class C family)/D-alanyl-D-alanine dipeptidase
MRFIPFCVTFCLVLMTSATYSQSTVTETPVAAKYAEAIRKLEAAIRSEVIQKNLPAFSMTLVAEDDILWSAGFGFHDAAKQIAASGQTIYRVGSVSKLFTDIAVMQQVEQGKLDLDAPVHAYLPDFQPRNEFPEQITLRQLMSHLSGLVRESPVGNYFDSDEPSLESTVDSLNETAIVYRPGTRTKYSNAAVSVVGRVLETQLTTSHPDQVQKTIFDPLKMTSSSFDVAGALQTRMATGWMRTLDGRRFEAPTFMLGTGPAGNLYSSTDDLARFLVCLFQNGRAGNGQILKAETLASMLVPVPDATGKPTSFGLGFQVSKLDGHRKVGHGGAIYGFSTQLEALPDRRLGVAAATSLDGANGVVGRLADYALRLMLAVQDNTPLPAYLTTVPIPSERARELVGTYRDQDSGKHVAINQLNGATFLRRGSYRPDLRASAEDGSIVVDDPTAFGTKIIPQTSDSLRIDGTDYQRVPDHPPEDCPDRWQGLIGEYGWDHNVLYILEDQGQLWALIEWFYFYPLTEQAENEFRFPDYGLYHGEGLTFTRDTNGYATEVVAAEVKFPRREVGTRNGETFRITPVKPIDELRQSALDATPPVENGEFLKTDLVEVAQLEPGILLDIRYATTNNFTGAVFYKEPRAFLQRPAAERLLNVHRNLASRGLGLLIHDAYRPWHVTKMFWDATPDSMKDFVADPSKGSRHNRGCAVDLTLYNLASGQPVTMVAGYDEFSSRSFPLYPGGTSRERWYRDLLRREMEAEEFTVYEFEWWHFDFRNWQKYRIGNSTFEAIRDPQPK